MYSPIGEFSRFYTAPELICGFEDNFELAQKADIYSLGCLLFELLDKRIFYNALMETNGKKVISALNYCVVDKQDFEGNFQKRLEQFNKLLDEHSSSIEPPKLYENTKIPLFIQEKLQQIINSMCTFDYRKRTCPQELNLIKEKLRFIIKLLQNAHIHNFYNNRKIRSIVRHTKRNNTPSFKLFVKYKI